MIEEFKVERFKSIESAELELGNVNVFVGANGSGKSNFLEAVAVLAAAASGKVDQESLVRRGCRPRGFLRPMFRDMPPTQETALEAKDKTISYAVDLLSPAGGGGSGWEFRREELTEGASTLVNRAESEKRGKGDLQTGLAALKLAEAQVSEAAAAFIKTVAGYSIYSADTQVMRGLVQDPQVRDPIGLSGGRLMEAVKDITLKPEQFQELSEEFSAAFEFLDRFNVFQRNPEGAEDGFLGFRDRYFRAHESGDPYILGANQVNEGALFFLFVAVLCLHPSASPVFAIENADHGLNPLLAKRMTTAICEWLLRAESRQVLMTTQSPLVLDGLPLGDERVRLFTVDRDNRGRTVLKRLVITDSHRKKAAEGWTLSRMWVNGLIGGVQNV